jgi:hypothetical protein
MRNFLVEEDGETTEYTVEQLVSAHNGEFGEAGEEWADAVKEQLEADGYFDEDDDEADAPEDEVAELAPWEQEANTEFEVKIERLESQLGRDLTEGEHYAIVNDVIPQGGVPDLVEVYGPQLAAREDSTDSRRALMAEEVEDGMAKAGTLEAETPEPTNADEARRAEMVEELRAAEAAEVDEPAAV